MDEVISILIIVSGIYVLYAAIRLKNDGQINKITTPNGNATSYNYDSFGRLNAVTDVNDKTLQKIEYNYRKK